ncbi:hypothetical protein NL676_012453 [Syzygium grande]|nr:hypothetical protein NL676_012453 [Syzygium grande]
MASEGRELNAGSVGHGRAEEEFVESYRRSSWRQRRRRGREGGRDQREEEDERERKGPFGGGNGMMMDEATGDPERSEYEQSVAITEEQDVQPQIGNGKTSRPPATMRKERLCMGWSQNVLFQSGWEANAKTREKKNK